MRLKGLDLNLLIALDILLDERSVSRAAARLHLSQPAASAALGRLRDFFKDELLVLHGKRMIPTSYAENLVPDVRRILAQVDGLISMSSEFDPSTSERVFRLMASDYITTVLITPVIATMHRIAPHVRLDIRLPDEQVRIEFERGEVDFLLTPEQYLIPNHPAELLLEEPHVVVGWEHNPVFDDEVTVEAFLGCGHVAVTLGPSRLPAYAEQELDSMGLVRRIETFAPYFSAVPWLLLETNRLAVIHGRLARAFAKMMPLKIAPLPMSLPVMREMVQFHSARTSDQGQKWLRQLLHNAVDDGIGTQIDV
jgi:LysR family nod box-dependent transcriptional activator